MQVLTFLRTNRKAKGEDGLVAPCYALLISELKKHLHSLGVPLPPAFATELQTIYRGYCKEGVLQLFLVPGATLEYVPSGVEGRKSPNTVYKRAVMLQKDVFSQKTISMLDEGTPNVCLASITCYTTGMYHPTIKLDPCNIV